MQHVISVSGGAPFWEFTEVQGSFFFVWGNPLKRLESAAKCKLKFSADSALCKKVFRVATWARVQRLNPLRRAEVQRNRTFCINMQILHRNGAFLSCSWGSGGWKNELCVPEAAGTGVSPKCLCLGMCKALNASFFLLQLWETPIFSIDFTQSSACPWRCDLYLGLIYFCHGCSIF